MYLWDEIQLESSEFFKLSIDIDEMISFTGHLKKYDFFYFSFDNEHFLFLLH